jgi:hypothetical protein
MYGEQIGLGDNQVFLDILERDFLSLDQFEPDIQGFNDVTVWMAVDGDIAI